MENKSEKSEENKDVKITFKDTWTKTFDEIYESYSPRQKKQYNFFLFLTIVFIIFIFVDAKFFQ
jgi:hypothetical protein